MSRAIHGGGRHAGGKGRRFDRHRGWCGGCPRLRSRARPGVVRADVLSSRGDCRRGFHPRETLQSGTPQTLQMLAKRSSQINLVIIRHHGDRSSSDCERVSKLPASISHPPLDSTFLPEPTSTGCCGALIELCRSPTGTQLTPRQIPCLQAEMPSAQVRRWRNVVDLAGPTEELQSVTALR